jgi:hypothetical protein
MNNIFWGSFTYGQSDDQANKLPIITVISPKEGKINQTVDINTSISDPDGNITSIIWNQESEFPTVKMNISQDKQSMSFIPTQDVTYVFSVEAIDNNGSSTLEPVLVNISSGSNSIFTQNMTNETIYNFNMTDIATSNMSDRAKILLEAAIKSLEKGDKERALTLLSAARQFLSGTSAQAKMHLEEGMKARSAGDLNNAIMHLRLAHKNLG